MRRLDRLFGIIISSAMATLFFVSPAFPLASSPVPGNHPNPVYVEICQRKCGQAFEDTGRRVAMN